MKSSYSQHSTYVKCPSFWNNSYVKRLESPDTGASLYFGSAIDAAVMALLEGNPDWKNKFYGRWKTAASNGKFIDLFDNPSVVYAHSDFDADILTAKELMYMSNWLTELQITINTDPVIAYKEIAKIKKNPYKSIMPEQLVYFNRCSWISLNRKGEILLDAFHKQFFPRIKKVVSTQKMTSIKDEHSGDSIVGVIDMVVELDGYDKPIIFDLKTAASPYDNDQLEVSDQLTLYAAMKGGEYNTDLVGYVVLCKNITKDIVATCQKCSNIRDSRHQTCNADINGARCGGTWSEKIVANPVVQVIVDKKNTFQIESLLNDMSSTILAMKNKIVYKNTAHCHNWYGSKCAYFDLCHKGDAKGLKNKGE